MRANCRGLGLSLAVAASVRLTRGKEPRPRAPKVRHGDSFACRESSPRFRKTAHGWYKRRRATS